MMLRTYYRQIKFACILALMVLLGSTTKGQFISGIGLQGGAIQTTFAPGDDIFIVGLTLYTVSNCDSIEITGPGTYYFRDSIDYTSVTLQDTLFLTLPLDMVCDSYFVTLLQHSACIGNSSSNTVPIVISDSISFSYSDSVFCVGETNPFPTLTTSHVVNPIWSSQSGGLALNSATGEIFLTPASLVTDNVIGRTAGTVCFDTDTFEVTVKDVTQGYTLSYPNSSECGNTQGGVNGFLEPLVAVPDSLGSFSSSPALVVFTNPDSGFIDLVNTPPGNYVIYYQPNPNACFQTTSFNLEITQPDAAVFNYLPTYCPSEDTIYPVVTQLAPISSITSGFQNGGLGTATPNQFTGAIDVSGLAPGFYSVAFQPSTIFSCGETVRDTFEVLLPPVATFSYPFDTFCLSSGVVSPNAITPGTYFDTASPPNLVILSPATGDIDISSSNPGGPYSVFHAVSNANCTDTAEVQLYIQDPANATVVYNSNTFCQNDSNPSPVFTGGLLGGTFSSTPALAGLNPSTGTIDLSVCIADTYSISYTLSIATCTSVEPVGIIRIDSLYPLDFSIPPLICEDTGNVAIQVIGGTTGLDNLTFNLFLGNSDFTAQGIANGDSINTNIVAPNGNYQVIMTVQEGVCSDTVSHFFNLYDRPDPTFEYLDTLLCQNADDPVPFLSGQGGGVYSSLDTGIVVNPVTGVIDLNGSNPGTYTIWYNADSICPAKDSDVVVIIGSNQAFFSYSTVEPCRDRDSLTVSRDTSFAAGIFTISPATGCFIDSTNGTLHLDSCAPGTYSITHTLASQTGDCEAVFITEVKVSQHDVNAVLDYGPNPVFCPSDSLAQTAVPLNNDTIGFFPGLTGLVFADTVGTIDLTLSQPGVYEVSFEIEGVCPLSLVDTVEVLEFTPPEFYYGTPVDTSNFYCTTDNNPIAFPETAPGFFEVFTNQRDTVPWVNPATGEFELDSVTSNVFSPFTICYSPDSAVYQCTFTHCEVLVVNLGPENAIMTISDDTICQGDTVTFRINGGDSQTWLVDNAPADSSLVFTPDPSILYDGIEITVQVGDNQNCNTTIDTNLTVYPVPQVVFTDVPTIVSSNNFVDILVTDPFVDNVTFDWVTSSIGAVDFQPPGGAQGPGLMGQDETISSLINLVDEASPASVIFTITPSTLQCTGEPVSDTIQVNPIDQPIFVPEVFTPNADGVNDVWQIQWRQDFDLSQYTMFVYNRSGAEVLNMSPVVPTWDGGSLPDGVYWWKLLNENGRRVLSGGVTIRRK